LPSSLAWSSRAATWRPRSRPATAACARGGRTVGLGVEFDVYWLSLDEMERQVTDAGFATVFWGGIPPEKQGASAQGYLLARKT
jgi:hypothetical protein